MGQLGFDIGIFQQHLCLQGPAAKSETLLPRDGACRSAVSLTERRPVRKWGKRTERAIPSAVLCIRNRLWIGGISSGRKIRIADKTTVWIVCRISRRRCVHGANDGGSSCGRRYLRISPGLRLRWNRLPIGCSCFDLLAKVLSRNDCTSGNAARAVRTVVRRDAQCGGSQSRSFLCLPAAAFRFCRSGICFDPNAA